jgi:hypothetical protein
MTIYVKDPEAAEDYKIDWADQLVPGDTIVASTLTPLDPGITILSSSFGFTSVTFAVSGGTVSANALYRIVNHVNTSQGRQDDQTIYLCIWEK